MDEKSKHPHQEPPKPPRKLASLPLPPLPDVVAPLGLGELLDSIAKNPIDRYYKDQTIYLDGYAFTNCCFNNCKLVTEAGLFVLRSCMIMPNCELVFVGNALRVVKLWNVRHPNILSASYNPRVEADGSVTIE